MARTFRFLSVVVCLTWAAIASAQGSSGSGNIAGVVTDQQGAGVPGVIVTAHGTEQSLLIRTGSDGKYTLGALVPGRYVITAAIDGYGTVVRNGVWVRVGKTATLPLVMNVVRTSETVTVTAPRRRRARLDEPTVEKTAADVLPSRNPLALVPDLPSVLPESAELGN